jgi:hypothetical protein
VQYQRDGCEPSDISGRVLDISRQDGVTALREINEAMLPPRSIRTLTTVRRVPVHDVLG